jgi:hypothetical protein
VDPDVLYHGVRMFKRNLSRLGWEFETVRTGFNRPGKHGCHVIVPLGSLPPSTRGFNVRLPHLHDKNIHNMHNKSLDREQILNAVANMKNELLQLDSPFRKQSDFCHTVGIFHILKALGKDLDLAQHHDEQVMSDDTVDEDEGSLKKRKSRAFKSVDSSSADSKQRKKQTVRKACRELFHLEKGPDMTEEEVSAEVDRLLSNAIMNNPHDIKDEEEFVEEEVKSFERIVEKEDEDKAELYEPELEFVDVEGYEGDSEEKSGGDSKVAAEDGNKKGGGSCCISILRNFSSHNSKLICQ